MKPIVLIYATREGHTRRIAEYIASILNRRQLKSDLIDAADIPSEFSLEKYSAVIVSASVHSGKHEREMMNFIKRHRAELERIPSAFLCVSLSEAGAEDKLASPEKRAAATANVKRVIDTFLAEAGWNPRHIKAVAGALMYLKYNFVIRLIMKRIARQEGQPTDTSRNYEFTDWSDLDQTVDEFVKSIVPEEMQQLSVANRA